MNLRAGILSYALSIGIVVSVILSSLTLFVYYHLTHYHNLKKRIQLEGNLNDAIAIYLQNPDHFELNKSYSFDLFGEGRDSIEILVKRWGIFDHVVIDCSSHKETLHKSFLSGRRFMEEAQSVLYLVDEGRPLSLVGDTRLDGDCYLPLSGVQSAYINRIGYKNEKLVYGEEKRSEKELPVIEISQIFQELQEMDVNFYGNDQDTLFSRSFDSSTLVLSASSYLVQSFRNHILIVSKTPVYVDSTCHLSDVLIFGPQITLGQGFTGRGQFFATDTIRLDSGVYLKYPSVLAVYNEHDQASIVLSEGSEMHGWIVLDGANDGLRQRVLHLENTSRFFGMIYCNGMLQMEGEVTGNVATRRFLVNSFSGIYENYLMNAHLNRAELDSAFLATSLWFGANKGEVLKYLD